MRGTRLLAPLVLLAALASCGGHGGTTSSGVFEVAITDEDLQTTGNNLCAVEGNATNAGNVRAHVELTYEALNASGVVIATSTASFEVAPFSNFRFGPSKLNSDGQPSSGTFDNGVACAGISRFRRNQTRTTAA